MNLGINNLLSLLTNMEIKYPDKVVSLGKRALSLINPIICSFSDHHFAFADYSEKYGLA